MTAVGWGILTVGTVLSVASLNLIPLVLALVISLAGSMASKPNEKVIKEAGRSPALPPPPTDKIGCLGCWAWFALWAVILTVLGIGIFGLATEGIGGIG